jgi:SAM-dependent methyltransferase
MAPAVRVPGTPGAGVYQYYRCGRCGLLGLAPAPSWVERQPYYDSGYRGYHDAHRETSSLQRRSMAYGQAKRLRLVERYCRGGRILDVGCGSGDFAAAAQKSERWQAHGMEQVAAVAFAARADYALPVTIADCAGAPYADGAFDAVCLWTVLEHVAQPVAALQECARLLRTGGVLLVRTVNAESWGAAWFGRFWLGLDAPRIVAVYSRASLRWVLEEAGFQVVEMGCRFHDFHPFLWSLHNMCQEYFGNVRWCENVLGVLNSPIVRAATLPFFMLQTALGKNSHFTAAAIRIAK